MIFKHVLSHMTKQKYLGNSNSCNNLYKDYRKKDKLQITSEKKEITQHLCVGMYVLYIHTSWNR